MENLLLKYFDSRITHSQIATAPGTRPFVTLSREFGCPSKLIAKDLAGELNALAVREERTADWQDINREIVEEAAAKLNVDPHRIRQFTVENKQFLYDVLSAFSDSYRSSRAIEKATREIIRSFALKGHVVILGRAGVAITQAWPSCLHVRLFAPIEWRVEQICRKRSITRAEATKLITEMDRNRTSLIELYLGRKFDPHIYDLMINCQTFSIPETVHSILGSMKAKSLI
ncbi:MAG: cytidylate kinase-like family protein [Bacteroidales bacterium]